MPPQTHALLKDFRLKGYEDVYVVGSLDARVTMYSQQVRALNLVHALKLEGRVNLESKVMVIGAGVAGIMAAVCAADVGATVHIVERQGSPLHLQTGSSRCVHPHILDFPDRRDADDADVPFFPWEAGPAHVVARSLLTLWKSRSEELGTTHRFCALYKTAIERIEGNERKGGTVEGPYFIKTERPCGVVEHGNHFDVVILACGFGTEAPTLGAPLVSYWRNEDIDQPELGGDRTRYLVSGNGDGGLVDALRVRVDGFRPDREFLRAMTAAAKNPDALASAAELVDRSSQKVIERLISAFWGEELQPFALRLDTEVTLTFTSGKGDADWSIQSASRLNRALFCWLLASEQYAVAKKSAGREYTTTRQAGTSNSFFDPNRRVFSVAFRKGPPETFDRVIIRHGAISPLLSLSLKNLESTDRIVEERQRRLKDPQGGGLAPNRATATPAFEPTFSRWLVRKDGLDSDLPEPEFEYEVRASVDGDGSATWPSSELKRHLSDQLMNERRLVVGLMRGRVGVGKGTALRRMVRDWPEPAMLLDCARYGSQPGATSGGDSASCGEALRRGFASILDGREAASTGVVLLGIDNLDRRLLSYELSKRELARQWVGAIIGVLRAHKPKARLLVLVSLDHALRPEMEGTTELSPRLTEWGSTVEEAFRSSKDVDLTADLDFTLRDGKEVEASLKAKPWWVGLDARERESLHSIAIYRHGSLNHDGQQVTRAELIRATAQKASHRYRSDLVQWDRIRDWLESLDGGPAPSPGVETGQLEAFVALLQDRANDTFSLLELIRSHFAVLKREDRNKWDLWTARLQSVFRGLTRDHSTIDRHGRALSPIASMLSVLGAFPSPEPGVPLRHANLSEAALFDADLSPYVFVAADFRWSMLSRARLRGADGSFVCFIGCDLAGSDLRVNPQYSEEFATQALTHCQL